MSEEPKIPFGYKQVQGQSQKDDGIWDAVAGKFRKVRKQYPFCGGQFPVIIRKCEAVQQELPCLVCGEAEPCSHDFAARDRQLEDIGRKMGTGCRIFEFE